MRIGKEICSLILASSAGLLTGLLFAPDKGSQTRKKIKQKANDILEDEIIGYNRILSNVKIKLDEILNGLSIPVDDNCAELKSIHADYDKKGE